MKNQLSKLTFFIIAGEASGDLHGAKLMQELQRLAPNISFIGHGGDKMIDQGLKVIQHIDKMSVMGFSEIIKHLPFLFSVMGETLNQLEEIKPNRIILIDYPGFNLRLAKNCSGLSIPITYFILPQLWAWKEKRIKTFQRYIDQSLSIFPFEQNWFEKRDVPTNYVGHPFTENIGPSLTKTEFYTKHKIDKNRNVVTLLPGSRQQEVDQLWPIFYKSAMEIKEKQDVDIVVGKFSGITLPEQKDVLIENDDIYAAISYAKAAITASGTASLECAVLDTPEVVCYKLSYISGLILKQLNKTPFISMVNLIANRKIVTEFVQSGVKVKNIVSEITPLLSNTKQRKDMLLGFDEVRRSLGLPGVYKRAAESIMKKTNSG
tara:strand:+ start:1715 stop:2842 length:1128 start_codon:yes stop_codon:yes gene_type:complete